MKTLRRALIPSAAAASVVLLAAWAVPAAPQEQTTTHTPVSRDGKYACTDTEGNFQRALDGALLIATDALSHQGGQVLSDVMFKWQVTSTTGVRGGLTGKRDVTVTIQVVP